MSTPNLTAAAEAEAHRAAHRAASIVLDWIGAQADTLDPSRVSALVRGFSAEQLKYAQAKATGERAPAVMTKANRARCILFAVDPKRRHCAWSSCSTLYNPAAPGAHHCYCASCAMRVATMKADVFSGSKPPAAAPLLGEHAGRNEGAAEGEALERAAEQRQADEDDDMNLPRCAGCDEIAHASETDNDGWHPACRAEAEHLAEGAEENPAVALSAELEPEAEQTALDLICAARNYTGAADTMRSLAAFGLRVLEQLEHDEEWGADTLAEIAHQAERMELAWAEGQSGRPWTVSPMVFRRTPAGCGALPPEADPARRAAAAALAAERACTCGGQARGMDCLPTCGRLAEGGAA